MTTTELPPETPTSSAQDASSPAPEPVIPPEEGLPTVEAPPKSAAGIPAVLSAMAYNLGEAGLSRTRALFRLNQQGGFDCPSCAWPDPKHRALAEFCENGARAVGDEATSKTVGKSFFAQHSIEDLLGRSDHWLNKQGRIAEPMVRKPGATHYEPISWDDAFTLLAEELNALASPDEAVFYTSGRTSNEAAFLYQLFVRAYGTNNLPDCSNMCHESSGYGLSRTIGMGKGSVTLEDFDVADVILVIGQNPGTNHPRMLSALESAKKKGATIISINPLEEVGLVRFKHPQTVSGVLGSGTKLTDIHLRVRVGGDLPLLYGLQKIMLENGHFDQVYIDAKTEGFAAFKAHLEGLDLDALAEASGISVEDMRAAAKVIGESKATIGCWAMGITQHENAVANVQAIVSLLLMGGHMGRPGAGVCPVRGHSNVQGDRTVGIWEILPPWGEKMGELLGFQVPKEMGFDVVATIEALRDGRAKVFFGMGGNFLSATPDTDRVAEGMRKAKMTVHVSTKLNRAHLVTGDTGLIFPCLGRTETDMQPAGPQFVSVENSMGIVSKSEGRLAPITKHLLSEVRIVARMAEATLKDRTSIEWSKLADNYDEIRDLIEKVVPGFDGYNARVREPNGFALPNPVRDGGFATPSGKGHFFAHDLPELSLPEGRFWLMTLRSHDQFNTTIYDLDDRYRGVFGHRYVVFVSEDDLEPSGLKKGDKVRLTSHFKGTERSVDGFVVIPYDIPKGNIAAYFPEANPLIPADSFAKGSRTPTSKRVEVSIEVAER